MGLKCKIHQDYVEAANGNKSNLFDEAMRYTGDYQKALDIYTVIHTPEYVESVHKPSMIERKSTISNYMGEDSISNIEGAELREVKVNDFRTFVVEFQGQNIGRIRTFKFQDGYKIESSLVKPEYQGQGVGTSLYNDVINKLVSENQIIYSDDSREPAAEAIWQKLYKGGIARQSESGYQIRPFPQTIDNNGEPRLSEVLKYVGAKSRENKELSFSQAQDIKNALLSEPNLKEKLVKAFLENGIFVVNKQKMLNADYSLAEANEIISSIPLQNQIKSTVESYLSSEQVFENNNSSFDEGNEEELAQTFEEFRQEIYYELRDQLEIQYNRLGEDIYGSEFTKDLERRIIEEAINKKIPLQGKLLSRKFYVGANTSLIPISEIKEYVGENRAANRGRIEEIKTSILQNGLQEPLILRYNEGEAAIGEGNHRIIALEELGYNYIPVEVRKDPFLPDSQRIKMGMQPLKKNFTPNSPNNIGSVSAADLGITSYNIRKEDYRVSPSIKNTTIEKNSNELTSLGLFKNKNPYTTEEELIQLLGGTSDREQFENLLSDSSFESIKEQYFNNTDFADNLYSRMQNLSRLREFKVNDAGDLVRKTNTETRDLFSETLLSDVDNNLNLDITYLESIPSDIWDNNPQEVTTLLKSAREKAVEYGIDLSELENTYEDKTQEEILSLLTAFKNINLQPNENTLKSFSEAYDSFYDVNKEGSVQIQRVPLKHREKSLVYLDTDTSEYELFNKHSLLKVENNIYQKVNKEENLDTLLSNLSLAVINNPSVLSQEIYKVEPSQENFEKIKENLKNFSENEVGSLEITNFASDNIEIQKMVLYKLYFNNDLTFETVSSPEDTQLQEFYLFEGDAEYLTTDFIADFNKDSIKNKQNKTEEFNNFYNHFEITQRGIQIKNTDPISMSQIKDYLESDILNDTIKENLMQYSLLSKNMDLTSIMDTNKEFVKTIDFERSYKVNNPSTVSKAVGEYTVINETTIASKNNPKFIRTAKGIFEAVQETGNVGFYKLLPQSSPNFNQFNIGQPELDIDVNDYAHLQSTPENSINQRNLYSQRELEQINQTNFDCV